MTICVTGWQFKVRLESICNSCDVSPIFFSQWVLELQGNLQRAKTEDRKLLDRFFEKFWWWGLCGGLGVVFALQQLFGFNLPYPPQITWEYVSLNIHQLSIISNRVSLVMVGIGERICEKISVCLRTIHHRIAQLTGQFLRAADWLGRRPKRDHQLFFPTKITCHWNRKLLLCF